MVSSERTEPTGGAAPPLDPVERAELEALFETLPERIATALESL